jgi:hypothetical protein
MAPLISSIRLNRFESVRRSLSGCADRLGPDRVTLALNQSPQGALAVTFEEIRLNHIPMTTALPELSNAIYKSPNCAFFPTLFGVSYGERKAIIRMIKVPTEPNLEDCALVGTKLLQTPQITPTG